MLGGIARRGSTLGVFVGCAFLGACGSEADAVSRASEALAEKVLTEAEPLQPPEDPLPDLFPPPELSRFCRDPIPPARKDEPFRLVLDASQSLQGFVGRGSKQGRFPEILDRIATLLGISEVTLFGEPSGPGEGLFTRRHYDHSLHDVATFDRLHNPDYCLVSALVQASDSATYLYITDGVQSSSEYGIPSPTARAYRQWLASGRDLAIVAFDGEYHGKVWSEHRRRWLDPVTIQDRPFFLVLFGPDSSAVASALSKLDPVITRYSGQAQPRVLRFSRPNLSCEVRPVVRKKEIRADLNWIFVDPEVLPQANFSATPVLVAAYTCLLPPYFPLATLSARLQVDYWRWDAQARDFLRLPNPPRESQVFADSVLAAPGTFTAFLQAVLAPDQASRFGFYRLQVSATAGDLPAWVREISTPDDSDPETFSKTYRFSWLVENLILTHFAGALNTVPLFLTLQYR